MKIPRKLSLRHYLTIGATLTLGVVVVLLLIAPIRMYQDLISQQNIRYAQDIAAQTSVGISNALNELDRKVDALIRDSDVYSDLARHDSTTPRGQYLLRQVVLKHFPVNSLDSYYLESLELYTTQGAYYGYGKKTDRLVAPFESVFYQRALKIATKLNWIGYDPVSDSVEVAQVIYDFDDYSLLGMVVMRLSQNFLYDKFREYNTIEIHNMSVVDSRGLVLCAKDYGQLGVQLDDEYFKRLRESSGWLRQDDQLLVYGRFDSITQQFPYRGWSILIEIQYHTIFAGLKQVMTLCIVLAVLTLAACLFLVLRLSRYVTQPLERLVEGMRQVQQGNLKVQVEEAPKVWEMQYVLEGFNSMVVQLDLLIATVYEERLAYREMQLKALQSQINPHFLFNTLQLISWRAKEYGAQPVCDMIFSLGCMLDMDLYSNEKTIPLHEELEYIRHYAFIIQQKYEDKIKIYIDVPPALEDFLIPKLSVQPFLENAVIHGLAQKPGEGQVNLTAELQDDVLVIRVEDNGVGIRPDRLRKLQEPGDDPSQTGHGIALENIQTRIKILYGPEYGFTIESKPYIGTKVTLRLPCMTEDRTTPKEGEDGQIVDSRG